LSKSIELSVKADPVWAEFISDLLLQKIGCTGVVTDEIIYKDEVVIKDSKGVVKGYLPLIPETPPNIENINNILTNEKNKLISEDINENNLGEWSLSFKEIDDEEWANSWKQYWHPQKISEKIVICPSWENYKAQENEIIISLDPGSAFGTGTHPTTRLCIQALEKLIQANDIKIADVGTGSGILSVVAVKLGAESAIGVDNDASVISVANENAEKNNIAPKCTFKAGVATDIEGQYDIVVANILAEVIIDIMPELVKLLKTSGKLVLSGIISSKSLAVQNSAISNQLKIASTLDEENWTAIIAEHNS